ncbi:hypothetical protein PCANC_07930 [Puccinia coronata f. sp. avenae]|uniref:Calcineurin-like phosphoesterase domain-containing protein n=1 Tax=Puccinia coronata f. sp. avenae TaxID=200324 RepID=A0A2N5UY95_9BASI|nr:hypothetical protein PCANC_07930 [Puccinia coronata f. sp. avenae]
MDSKQPLIGTTLTQPVHHSLRTRRDRLSPCIRATASLFLFLFLTLLCTTYFSLFPTSHHPHPRDLKNHDYDRFVWHKDILEDWDPNSDHRLIAFGDIHGMVASLKELLKLLDYNPRLDTILLVGDLAAKHPSIQASLDTIRYCRESKVEGVRGNHDEYIIIWRNWMETHRVKFVDSDTMLTYQSDNHANLESDFWLQTSEPPKELKKKLPNGMDWGTQHFEIARRLPKIDFHWLLERSLTIYVAPLRTYFAHAGMLPWVPPNELKEEDTAAREVVSLLQLKENKESFTLLEMRGLKKGRRPSKDGNKGKPWYKYWNKTMQQCKETSSGVSKEHGQWCERPEYVVYGHWAGKGLKIKPWSIGLDSGCVYGRQLSALVFGKPPPSATKKHKHQLLKKPISAQINHYNATIFQLNCREP